MDLALVARLQRLVGVEEEPLGDEHVRWGVYQKALDTSENLVLLRDCVAAEDDQALASSVVVHALEKVGRDERPQWVDALRPEASGFAARRCRELGVLEDVLSGDHPLGGLMADLAEWSDWLQLSVAGASRDPRALEAVAAEGRTKRIRRLARESRAAG